MSHTCSRVCRACGSPPGRVYTRTRATTPCSRPLASEQRLRVASDCKWCLRWGAQCSGRQLTRGPTGVLAGPRLVDDLFWEAGVDLSSAACASFSGAAMGESPGRPCSTAEGGLACSLGWWNDTIPDCLRYRPHRQAPHLGAFLWAWAGAGSSPPCPRLWSQLSWTTTRRMPCHQWLASPGPLLV